MFFNQLLVWYVIFNLIRKDKQFSVAINKVWEEVSLKRVDKLNEAVKLKEIHIQRENYKDKENYNEIRIEELALQFKAHENKDGLNASQNFSDQVNDFYQKNLKEEKTVVHNLIYILLQPPIIAIFCGFILGLIPSLQNWWFNTHSAVFVINSFYSDVSRYI